MTKDIVNRTGERCPICGQTHYHVHTGSLFCTTCSRFYPRGENEADLRCPQGHIAALVFFTEE